MKDIKHYLTTPLYYVNSNPHIGHTYTTVVVDVIKKYYELMGEDTFFLTGTDEHGEKIFQAAAGEDVQKFVDLVSDKFRKMWDNLSIDYDDFIRTTDIKHTKVVQDVLQKLYDAGDIYFDSYEGNYCVACERFLNYSELQDGLCQDHKQAPKKVKEENYFFKLKKYAPALREEIIKNENLIRPNKFRNEVLEYLTNNGSLDADLCISRPKTRLTWGIDLPFDNNFVTYVWFDALLNYVSALSNLEPETFKKYWAVSEHFIAKDILRTHTVYWGTMLLAMGLPLYNRLNVHGYWNIDGMKMSKTIGNVVDPAVFKDSYGDENLRFFFLREMHWGDDADFTMERFITRYNADLANNYGNLISRTFGMITKYCASQNSMNISENLPIISPLKDKLDELLNSYETDFKEYNFYKTLELMWSLFDNANKFVAESAPWDLYKNKDFKKLNEVLSSLVEIIRICTSLLYPVLPKTSLNILGQINAEELFNEGFKTFKKWGALKFINTSFKQSKFFERIQV